MTNDSLKTAELLINLECLTEGEKEELIKLGIISKLGDQTLAAPSPPQPQGESVIRKRAIHAPQVLNEAYHYARPSSFSRGLRIDIGPVTVILISGTASVNEEGKTIHIGDFRAQTWRTYRNISTLLRAENASWHDVIRATCYLRDIERDYKDFNEIRTAFFSWLGLDPLPASVGVQTRLCREDLLVEIEAVALIQSNGQ
jgi:2-iminobutanoate/2-iminopropanoate deaminase